MIPLSNILKDSDSKLIVIRRVKKRSYPPEEDDRDVTVAKEITPNKEISIKKEKLRDRKSNIEVEEEPVVIRKKIKR